MSEQAAFREAMRANPHDAQTRLVYADWLDEHDQPKAAARLRWWAGLIPHLDTVRGVGNTTSRDKGALPAWVRTLILQHTWRHMAHETPDLAHYRDHLWPAEEWAAIHETPVDVPNPRPGYASAIERANQAGNPVHYVRNGDRALDYSTENNPTKLSRKSGTSNPRIVEDARVYHEKHGAALGLKPFDPTPSKLTVTPEQSQKIVSAYEARKHDPADPETKAAYDAFKRETLQQYLHAVSRGLKVMRWPRDGQPYANSEAMRDHVDRDHAIYYFPTANGYEPADAASHPPMEQVPGMPEGVLYNDLFRAVHEYFAHAMHGHQFGPVGELRAWHEHAKMYSPLARRALTNETLGQTQWFFHGPHRDKPVPERPFPEQRAAMLPEDVEPVKLARDRDRVAEDVRMYRQHVRSKMPYAMHKLFNTPAEHPYMHDWFVKRGLKVQRSNYTWYDDKTHTLYHHKPEDKSSVVVSYLSHLREPVKLARNEYKQLGAGAANRQIDSGNNQARVQVARSVLAEAGLQGARVAAVLAHSDPRGARPAVAAMIAKANPRVARYAAAWLGLLTGQPHVTVFHPGEGEDTLHIIDTPAPSDHVGEYLRRAGVPQFTIEQRGSGTRVYVVNPMGLVDVPTAARGLNAQVQSIKGSAIRLGAGSEKDARASYRAAIDDAEKEAGQ